MLKSYGFKTVKIENIKLVPYFSIDNARVIYT